MLIQASDLIGLPVGALNTQSKIGQVQKIIIDPANGKLLGFEVKKSGFFSKNKILSAADILEFEQQGLVTGNEENLVNPEEVIRIKEVIGEKIKVLGAKAITESKKYLGRIYDLLIDTDNLMVVKYYIKNLWQDRIVPSNKVVKIEKKGVIFAEDIVEETAVTEPEGAAA